MFRLLKPACVLLLLMTIALSCRTAAAASWIGVQIMPKSANALLRVGGQIVGDVSSVHWPTSVKTVDGTWLWVEDDGSTSHPRVAGWLRSSDAMQVNDEAVNYFSNRLLDAPDDGGLYWLRGMCWENSGEYKLAAKDYQDAIAREPSHLHAHLALARTTAKEKYDEKLFLAAQQRNPGHPGLYVDWGHALEAAKLDEQAGPKYQQAAKLSPNWWTPRYSLGKLNSSQGNQAAALAHLEDAIRRDPKCHFAYCERAKILLSSKKELSEQEIGQVLQSVLRACDLTSYHNEDCLSAAALAFARLKDWDDAKRFQGMAAEYAPSLQEKHDLWATYKTYAQIVAAENASDAAANAQQLAGAAVSRAQSDAHIAQQLADAAAAKARADDDVAKAGALAAAKAGATAAGAKQLADKASALAAVAKASADAATASQEFASKAAKARDDMTASKAFADAAAKQADATATALADAAAAKPLENMVAADDTGKRRPRERARGGFDAPSSSGKEELPTPSSSDTFDLPRGLVDRSGFRVP